MHLGGNRRRWVPLRMPLYNQEKHPVMELHSSQVKRTPQDSINEFIIQKLNPLVLVDFRFISAFLHA